MPKRPASTDEEFTQPIKKQQNSKTKSRNIRSLSSERSLQLLYEGASKYGKKSSEDQQPTTKQLCCLCSSCLFEVLDMKCNFCDQILCPECKLSCFKCEQIFCPNCSFPSYDENEAACYSCYG